MNLGEGDADVVATAYASDGQLLQGQGIENPVQFEVKAGTQSGTITASLFGAGPELADAAWFQAVSEGDDLTGFFLHLDTTSTFLDGADLPPLSSRLVFSDVRVGAGERTELNLINPTSQAAEGEIRLISNEGSSSRPLNLPARGAVRLDVEELFSAQAAPAGVLADDPLYVTVESDQELAGFEFVQPASDLLGLNARPASELLNTLFFPQLAVLGLLETELMVVSLAEEEPAILTITAFQPDGNPFGAGDLQTNPVTRVLEAGAVLREGLQEMFGFSGEETLDGWLQVESTSLAVQGAISYAIPALGSIASVASVASGTKSAVFSHIATTFDFFTGIAILNAGKLVANVRITAVQQDGIVLGSFKTTLGPGQRLSRTLTEMIPAAAGKAGGFILIRSDIPVHLTSVFGNLVSGVLSNVPPQPAPEAFEVPDAGEEIEVSPALAIVPVAGMQQFEVSGPKGVAEWSVNGDEGGGAVQGTIDGTGRYTAPALIPGSLPVVVAARIGEDSAGATTDVLGREVLAGNLGVVQSVAYLSGLQRLYTSELSAGPGPSGSSPQGGQNSTIFDVTGGLPAQLAEFSGEDVPKIIRFLGSDGKEYLLLAAKTTGRVLRLDPQSAQSSAVVTGLQEPVALVIDSVNGDLLVAEEDRVIRVAADQLSGGLAGTPSGAGQGPLGDVVTGLSPAGLAVDRCSGDIYVSDAATGDIRRVDRLSGAMERAADDLLGPGQLLGLYRAGITCPDSFHLLIAEREAERVSLLTPQAGPLEWVSSPGIRDLTLRDQPEAATPASTLTAQPGILLGEVTKQVGLIVLVPGDLYEGGATNPDAGNQLLTGIVDRSSNVRLLASPPPAVGDEDLTHPDDVHVFLEKVLTLSEDLTPDTGAVIPMGSRVRSYFFHYDPPGAKGGILNPGFVRFDEQILGVIFETATLDATDPLLGSAATDYSGTAARVWFPADAIEIGNDPRRVDFSAFATFGQDQMRVLLPAQPLDEVVVPSFGPYQITPVGQTLGLGGLFDFIDMNALAEVVFVGVLGEPLIWLPSANYGLEAGLSTFELPPGDDFFLPAGINDSGQVVGNGTLGVWLWEAGSFQLLPAFSSVLDPAPRSINNPGEITGSSDATGAFLFTGGSVLELGSPIGGVDESAGLGLNNLGQVAGGLAAGAAGPAGGGSNLFFAVIWPSGPGSGQVIAEEALAFDINDSAQVVYTSFDISSPGAFLWQNGSATNLGNLGMFPTQALGLNNLGHVVGSSSTAVGAQRAFLWIDGEMVDVNERLSAGPMGLETALDSTDSGSILCQTGLNIYLLTPVGQ